MLRLQVPDTNDKQIKMFTSGLKRVISHAVKQAEPITSVLLLKMSKVVNYSDRVEMVAWTATLIGFYLFLRKSNLVPDTMTTFDQEKQFCRGDVNLLGVDKAMMVEIRWSKTIQHKQKILRLPVLPADNKAVCPVFWMHYMVTAIPAMAHHPTFTIALKPTILALSVNQLIYRFRKWLKLINQEADKFSLHSLRRGGTTFAYQSDIEGEMIKLLGDWASDAYKRYIDVSMDKRFESMRTFVDALNKLVEASYI